LRSQSRKAGPQPWSMAHLSWRSWWARVRRRWQSSRACIQRPAASIIGVVFLHLGGGAGVWYGFLSFFFLSFSSFSSFSFLSSLILRGLVLRARVLTMVIELLLRRYQCVCVDCVGRWCRDYRASACLCDGDVLVPRVCGQVVACVFVVSGCECVDFGV